ncbi:MAG: YiiX/YebB-like N1pC/P60 family cysteine hydrolase [Deltaproteobacteria bacterium]|nr:YiiX/YebB-like N1pC/P60 family cysteine hydrolase [Deltaproteobacteria bacterium]
MDSRQLESLTGTAARAGGKSYTAVRHELVSGDILCFRGRGLVSGAIRWLTRSPYSHVGLVYVFKQRVFCLEATGIGVHLILMSELVKRYHGGIDYYALRDVPPESRDAAIDFGFGQLGKLYDHAGILRFFWFLLVGARRRSRERSFWYCSEIVAECYRAAGVTLVPGRVGYVSPADLAASPRLAFAFRIKRD